MAWSEKLNQNTYNDASFAGNNYSDESTGLPALVRDFAEHGSNIFYANSNTSNTIGTGSKTFTLLDSKRPFSVNMPIVVKSASSPANLMTGVVTAYSKTTDSLTVSFTYSTGSGTFTDWIMEVYWIDYTSFTTNFAYKGALASNPGSASTGDLYFNTSSSEMRVYNGSAWAAVPTYSVASTTVQGIVELATDAETQTGTDTTRAVTPSNLTARTATETRTGIAEIATQAEVDARTDATRIVTPAYLATGVEVQGSNIASSSTITLPSVGTYFFITGSTNISTISTRTAGRKITLRFDGSLSLIHSAGLDLPTASNLTVFPGDNIEFVSNGAGWVLLNITKQSGRALIPTTSLSILNRTSNAIIAINDISRIINVTSGSFTQTFETPANLTAGFWCMYYNRGTGKITIPSSDGVSNWIMYPGEGRIFQSDASTLTSFVVNPFIWEATSTENFIKPPGYTYFEGLLWGAGGSGARGTFGGGGGGGACVPMKIPSASLGSSTTFTAGAGGAGQTSASTSGNQGGNSTFHSFTSYGGGPGTYSVADSTALGGGGGGALSAAVNNTGGEPLSGGAPAFTEHGGVWASNAKGGGGSVYGGAGGRGATTSANTGGNSIFGGAGGAGTFSATAGTSNYGGNGGASGTTVSGVAGSPKGGGGGATQTGVTSGAGGSGAIQLVGIV